MENTKGRQRGAKGVHLGEQIEGFAVENEDGNAEISTGVMGGGVIRVPGLVPGPASCGEKSEIGMELMVLTEEIQVDTPRGERSSLEPNFPRTFLCGDAQPSASNMVDEIFAHSAEFPPERAHGRGTMVGRGRFGDEMVSGVADLPLQDQELDENLSGLDPAFLQLLQNTSGLENMVANRGDGHSEILSIEEERKKAPAKRERGPPVVSSGENSPPAKRIFEENQGMDQDLANSALMLLASVAPVQNCPDSVQDDIDQRQTANYGQSDFRLEDPCLPDLRPPQGRGGQFKNLTRMTIHRHHTPAGQPHRRFRC